MSALSTLRTYVKRDFKRTDKDTEITQAINDMIMWVASLMPHGNYKYQSWIYTISGREDYSIPSTLIHLIHPIKYIYGASGSNSGYPMDHLTKQEYDVVQPNPNGGYAATGAPSYYTVFSRSILVGPLPNTSSDILEINWAKKPVALSADADLPDLGSEWDEVIKQGAQEKLYAGIGMIEEANYWGGLYRDAEGSPVGLCKNLIDAEKDRESRAIGIMVNNDL